MSSLIEVDPIAFVRLVWPKIKLYDKQREILYSVRDNDETVVPAGNMLGKDFISAIVALWFFCTRRPARVVTTSVKFDQLDDVLWGEIRRLIETAEIKLPIKYNHMKIRQVRDDGTIVPLAELVGQVCSQGESIQGRHSNDFIYGKVMKWGRDIPRSLVIFDEASGIDDDVYNMVKTWAHRILIIGNCLPTTNFFYQAVKGGDILRESGV